MTKRIRSGFFHPSPLGVQVWVSYAGTGEDVLLQMSLEQLEAALRRGAKHVSEHKGSYGLGTMKEIDQHEQLYILEAFYNETPIMPVFNRTILQSIAKMEPVQTEVTNEQLGS